MRLNAFLARAGVASRRKADELIKAGRIKVNNHPGELNTTITQTDIVTLDDKRIRLQQLRYVLLYKPAGYVTTLSDPQGRPKITDLINILERVVPVGRLDSDTTGALLLTNDGELANKLMHPRFEVDKVYEAEIKGKITPKILNTLSNGVILEDGKSAPAKVKQLAGSRIELIIHEGRKHQVKRMLAVVGLPVQKLHRSEYALLKLKGLKPGQWRDLSQGELASLKKL